MTTMMTNQPISPPEIDGGYKRPKNAPRSLFEPTIVKRAVVDAFRKLDPRLVAKNPVMFVVEVGSVMTTYLFLKGPVHRRSRSALHRPDSVVAVVHGSLRQLRRGNGRRARQGAGRSAAQDQDRDHGAQTRGRQPRGARARHSTPKGRCRLSGGRGQSKDHQSIRSRSMVWARRVSCSSPQPVLLLNLSQTKSK